MKFLVTGASGFLGKGLVDLLTKDGHEVVLVSRKPDSEATQTVSTFPADLSDLEALNRCKEQHPDIEAIVHLAAAVPKTKEDDQAVVMADVNVRGTINLFEVFGEQLKSFVYASTAEVYGLPQTAEPISEDMVPTPLSHYGASKLAGEHFAHVYGERLNIPVSMLRFTVLYGPGDTITRAIPNFVKQALAGKELEVYGGEELRDYLHVSDAIQAVYLAATKPVGGVFNIGTGKGVTIKHTAETIAQMINPDSTVRIQPREKKAADIVLNVDRAASKLGFQAKLTFPNLLDEQITWHKEHEDLL